MNKLILGALVLLMLSGVFFFGSGITGFVVSETCCFPPNCPVENQCPAENSNNLLNGGEVILGIFLIAIAGVTYGLWYIGSRL